MKRILEVWLIALIVKLALAAWLPLTSDEAYYWVWSHHLQLSYFDHPGMIAWLLWLGHFAEHWAQAVRWPAVVLAHLSILVWLYALKPFLSINQLWWFFLLLLFNPLTGPGSLIVTPDLPLLFFWACAVFAFRKILDSQHPRWYFLLGLALGLGFSSKYPVVIFVPILLAWLALSRLWYLWRWREIGLTILAGILGAAPVFLWNLQHHLASFAFQLHHGLGSSRWDPTWPLSYLAVQFLLIFPIVFVLALKQTRQTRPSWLPYFAWGPLIFFGLAAFKAPAEANWPITAYPAIMALAAMSSHRNWLMITVATWAVALGVVLSQLIHPWIPNKLGVDWRFNDSQMYEQIGKLTLNHQPLFASSYQMASQLSFELKKPMFKLRGLGRHDFFDEIPESIPTTPIYFLVAEPETPIPASLQKQGDQVISRQPINSRYDLIEVKRH